MTPATRFLRIVVEGLADEAVARRLAETCGFDVGPTYVKRGKQEVDPRLPAYAAASKFGPWLVLRDLDHDADCAPSLLDRLIPERPPSLLVRIPVRSVESWLLADHENLAAFLGVSRASLPAKPDELDHPKRALVALAARSRRRRLRRDMLPGESSTASIGPAYTSRVIEFVGGSWMPYQAAPRSPSLHRCLSALQVLRSAL
jgi:hypothetical protein